MKLSIVVPVYNTETWLAKCLDSLIPETRQSCEIIAVNDGSTDSSPAILKQYRDQYPELIRIIETPNGGLGHARNTGLESAEGEYVLFVDSDDYLSPGAVDEMLETLEKNPGIDAVVFDLVHVDENGTELRQIRGTEHGKVFSLAADPCTLFSPHNAVNRLWRRSLFTDTGIRFPDRLWFEDLATVPRLLLRCGSILPVRKAWYCYSQRTGSIMNTAHAARNAEMIDVAETVLADYRNCGALERFQAELEYKFWYEEFLAAVTRVNRIDSRSPVQARLRDDYIRRFPDWQKNPYIRSAPARLRLLADLIQKGRWGAVRALTDLNNLRKGR